MPSDRHESNYRLNHYSESTTRPPFCEVAVAMARLVLNCGGVDLVTYKLGNVTTIGRAPLNQIVIDNPAVSAQHAIIARSDECYRLKDLHSTNGTKVNDVPLRRCVAEWRQNSIWSYRSGFRGMLRRMLNQYAFLNGEKIRKKLYVV